MTAYFSELEFGPSTDTMVSFPQEIFIKILNHADLFLREYKWNIGPLYSKEG